MHVQDTLTAGHTESHVVEAEVRSQLVGAPLGAVRDVPRVSVDHADLDVDFSGHLTGKNKSKQSGKKLT